MLITAELRIPFPRSLVYITYRDKLVELIPYISNVRSVEVKSRREENERIYCVNFWRGGGRIPLAVRAVLGEAMLSWTEYETASALLGENFRGILNSDRYSAYNWLDVAQRQLCWAHLKREFTKISERSGVSRQLGRDLLAQQKKLFRLWHRVRDGTRSRTEFQSLLSPIRERVRSLLEQGADYQIGSKEKTPLAKTVRTCRQLLKVEPALWLFVTVSGLSPTNNAAERAIRPAVLWRRTSFGSQSKAGSVFVARMLTVVTSLRDQNRNVLEFMTEAVRASREGTLPPSLLPQPSQSHLSDSIGLSAPNTDKLSEVVLPLG